MGKHPSMDWAARDTVAQSVDSHVATSVCWTTAKRIPSCRGGGAAAKHQLCSYIAQNP
jgi:hypothetical protein